MTTKYRHQEESEREEAIVLLGSTGAPGASKHLRALKKEAKKQERAAAKQSTVNRFFRPPRLSIEFAFIVLQRDRCIDAVRRMLGLSGERALHTSGVRVSDRVRQYRDRLLQAYHHGDRALPAQLLRRICSSGHLRRVVMQLTQFRNGPSNHEAGFCIVARVAAQHMRVARTPESDFEQGHRAWAAGQCRASIAFFERAIDGGHVNAHGALAWLQARHAEPRRSAGRSFHLRTLELAKKGARMGCRDSLAILAEMYNTVVYWSKSQDQVVSFAEKDKTERKHKPFCLG